MAAPSPGHDGDRRDDAAEARELEELLRFLAQRHGALALALVAAGPDGPRVLSAYGADPRDPDPPFSPAFLARALEPGVVSTEAAPDAAGRGVPAWIVAVPVPGPPERRVMLCALLPGLGLEEGGVGAARAVRALASSAALIGLWLEDLETVTGLFSAAYRDSLTGCLSYLALMQAVAYEVERAERYGGPLSCCFVDLDDFKRVNEELGHLAGNRLLAAVGKAIRDRARKVDIVGRYGGDEFVVLLPSTDRAAAALFARSLREAVRSATLEALELPLGVSVGLSAWRPGLSPEDLLREADASLREIKRRRRAAP